MKKAFILCLILVLILIPAGCKSPSEMAAEKLTEKVLEDITGGKVNVDGEKVTIETEDGSELSLGGNECLRISSVRLSQTGWEGNLCSQLRCIVHDYRGRYQDCGI